MFLALVAAWLLAGLSTAHGATGEPVIVAHQHPATPDGPVAAVRSVAVSDATFSPNALVVAPGTTVTWHNDGGNRHSVTADGDAFDSPTLVPGDRFTVGAPATPGVYAYHCRFHSFMRGTLTVSLVSLASPMPVTVGGRPGLTGTVPNAADGTVVTVERRVPGAWEQVGTTTTDASGAFTIAGPPVSARTAFRAISGESVSPSIRAEARPALVVARSGGRLALRVRPAGGGPAFLERLNLDTYRWEMVASHRLSAGHVRFTLKAPGVYRAMVEARGGLTAATSRVVQFRPGAFRE